MRSVFLLRLKLITDLQVCQIESLKLSILVYRNNLLSPKEFLSLSLWLLYEVTDGAWLETDSVLNFSLKNKFKLCDYTQVYLSERCMKFLYAALKSASKKIQNHRNIRHLAYVYFKNFHCCIEKLFWIWRMLDTIKIFARPMIPSVLFHAC